jgi:hypothetical protein
MENILEKVDVAGEEEIQEKHIFEIFNIQECAKILTSMHLA